MLLNLVSCLTQPLSAELICDNFCRTTIHIVSHPIAATPLTFSILKLTNRAAHQNRINISVNSTSYRYTYQRPLYI
jgi:hypothetical protein